MNTLDHRVTDVEDGRTTESLLQNTMGFSRKMIRRLKKHQGVKVNGQTVYLNYRVKGGDILSVDLKNNDDITIEPQNIPLDIIYQDQHLMVVNKPPHMLVHPLKHEQHNTLANAVLFHYHQNNLDETFRPVSRLDRGTSGLVVIAKHSHAGHLLAQQLQTGNLRRQYLAVAHGLIRQPRGVIALPIGQCADSNVKHEVSPYGRRAVTRYQVISYTTGNTVVKLDLETGRTHQIRVHLSHIGYPLVGDALYGGISKDINRQALHCYGVSFSHPLTGEYLTLDASTPEDIQRIINKTASD